MASVKSKKYLNELLGEIVRWFAAALALMVGLRLLHGRVESVPAWGYWACFWACFLIGVVARMFWHEKPKDD